MAIDESVVVNKKAFVPEDIIKKYGDVALNTVAETAFKELLNTTINSKLQFAAPGEITPLTEQQEKNIFSSFKEPIPLIL